MTANRKVATSSAGSSSSTTRGAAKKKKGTATLDEVLEDGELQPDEDNEHWPSGSGPAQRVAGRQLPILR